jgi:hypothetical protein
VLSLAAPCKEWKATQPTTEAPPNTTSTNSWISPLLRSDTLSLKLACPLLLSVLLMPMSKAVSMALMSTFGYRCAPPAAVIPSQGPQLQSICIAEDCPISPNATCSSYDAATEPAVANGSTSGNATSTSGSATSTGSTPATATSVSGAGITGFSFAALAVGLAAFLL